jgi:hypothetical protein
MPADWPDTEQGSNGDRVEETVELEHVPDGGKTSRKDDAA